ncbi:aldo/keto reductase [Devosia sp. BSSL-BM10]|uniref:Aldo/keto reductase n=1 Tax=Devosia litorisediminis TaxID=2829817 RepID=A0A942EAD9_9HYPH|nr:aldo/keto reductase [Devosia litorisediminis]MBS3850541.1 aldo/keto reductase [Devosia litorisediminis]
MSTQIKLWNGRTVPRVGLGCWAIGGTTANEGPSTSYGKADDAQSRAALRAGYEMGARVFDTAAAYGAGHSEMLVGEEISHHDDAIIITKFGVEVDFKANLKGAVNVTPEGIRGIVDGSRSRLKRDCLDLVLLHVNDMDPALAPQVFDTLEAMVGENKIGAYGWSTDFMPQARAGADYPHCVAFENDYNVFTPAAELMGFAQDRGLISISRLPLAMGLLTGKYLPDAQLNSDDVRAQSHEWLRFFKDGKPSADYLNRLAAIRDLLQSGGRSLPQGALGWILAASPIALPVPGFRNEAQVRDNIGALEKGPLPPEVMAEIAKQLAAD